MHLSDQLTALAASLTAVCRVVDRKYRTSHYWGRLIQVKLRTIINILFLDSKSSGERVRQDAGCIGIAGGLYYLCMLQKLLRQQWWWQSLCALSLNLSGCATELPVTVAEADVSGALVVGRVATTITGHSQRVYPPELRSFELINTENQERFKIYVKSADGYFSLSLPPGRYAINRVQVSEGPFLSMAQLTGSFVLEPDVVTFLGTWRFGVDSPKYGRQVMISIIHDEQDHLRAQQFVKDSYPTFDAKPVVVLIPEPSHEQARLFEVMPYPNYPRYFRRHWW
jgi:hypothetical protein